MTAIPTLQVTERSRSSSMHGARIPRTMRSAMRPTSSSSRKAPHSTTNSSPPRRATVSAFRDRSESLRPTSVSTWSPPS